MRTTERVAPNSRSLRNWSQRNPTVRACRRNGGGHNALKRRSGSYGGRNEIGGAAGGEVTARLDERTIAVIAARAAKVRNRPIGIGPSVLRASRKQGIGLEKYGGPWESRVSVQDAADGPSTSDLIHPAVATAEKCRRIYAPKFEGVGHVIVGRPVIGRNIVLVLAVLEIV